MTEFPEAHVPHDAARLTCSLRAELRSEINQVHGRVSGEQHVGKVVAVQVAERHNEHLGVRGDDESGRMCSEPSSSRAYLSAWISCFRWGFYVACGRMAPVRALMQGTPECGFHARDTRVAPHRGIP